MQRLPQHELARYLGITPVSLSRIRARQRAQHRLVRREGAAMLRHHDLRRGDEVAGAGNLDKWMTAHSGEDDPLMFVESIPVSETRDYIKRVIANVWMYRSRLGEPADGLDDAAAGHWPVYKQAGTMAAR